MKSTKSTRIAAMNVLDKMQEKVAEKENIIHFVENEKEQKTEEWILHSWCMEVQLLKNAIEDLKNQIIEDEFDF